jgi:Lon protease-like protein
MADKIPFQMDIEGKRYTMFATDTDDPVSLDYIVRAVNAHAALLAALEAVEWVGHSDDLANWLECPSCRGNKLDGHALDCQLARAIT